jgi:hypothetical protein
MKGIAAGLGLVSVSLMGWSLWMGTVQAAGQDETAKREFYGLERSLSFRRTATGVMVGWKATVNLPDKHGLRALKGATLEPRFL